MRARVATTKETNAKIDPIPTAALAPGLSSSLPLLAVLGTGDPVDSGAVKFLVPVDKTADAVGGRDVTWLPEIIAVFVGDIPEEACDNVREMFHSQGFESEWR